MRSIMTLVIFIVVTSGCASQPEFATHPNLAIPPQPALPKFTRAMLDCGQHNPSALPLCKRIKEREVVLQDYSDTLIILIKEHNEFLAGD